MSKSRAMMSSKVVPRCNKNDIDIIKYILLWQ